MPINNNDDKERVATLQEEFLALQEAMSDFINAVADALEPLTERVDEWNNVYAKSLLDEYNEQENRYDMMLVYIPVLIGCIVFFAIGIGVGVIIS